MLSFFHIFTTYDMFLKKQNHSGCLEVPASTCRSDDGSHSFCCQRGLPACHNGVTLTAQQLWNSQQKSFIKQKMQRAIRSVAITDMSACCLVLFFLKVRVAFWRMCQPQLMSAVNSSSVRTNQLCSIWKCVSEVYEKKNIEHDAVNKWEHLNMREL